MNLLDEEKIEGKRDKVKTIEKIIIVLIILLILIGMGIAVLIIYTMKNPTSITTYIDGVIQKDFDKLLDFETDEYGNTQIYIPIREVDSYLGYKSYSGEYEQTSEETDKCYLLKEGRKVSAYTLNSKRIYMLNLQNSNKEYDYYDLKKTVFESNGKLYTSIEGIEQGYDVSFSYDDKTKTIKIYTLDYLIQGYKKLLEKKNIENYGFVDIDEKNYQNCKAALNKEEVLMVVKCENGKYGVIDMNNYTFRLEPKYDNINYVEYSSDFLVQSNGKYGIISKDGKTKVTVAYDELILMDRNLGLYRVKRDNLYGVIDENENVIINAENNKIGIDIKDYSRNGIKSGYIIMNELIPVENNGLWGFYNCNGKLITDGFKYKEIGCKESNSNNIYSLLEIPGYDVIVVGDGKTYSFMDKSGNDTMLPFVFEKVFIQISQGETKYVMTYKENKYDVLKYLEQRGITENIEKTE